MDIVFILSGMIFLASLAAISYMVAKKSKSVALELSNEDISIKKFLSGEALYFERAIQKILISLRILILKADSGTYKALNKLRERAKNRIKDKYWENLKKAKKQ